jgi:hypothetical protein
VTFSKAVEEVLPDAGEKVQLVVKLKGMSTLAVLLGQGLIVGILGVDVLSSLLPIWQRYLDIATLILARNPSGQYFYSYRWQELKLTSHRRLASTFCVQAWYRRRQ